MLTHDELEALKARWICHSCVGEIYLSQEIEAVGGPQTCSYCGATSPAYCIGDMADRIEEAFEDHYIRTSDQPASWQISMLADKESDYEWDRDGEPVVYAIMNAADISEEAAEDIQRVLEDRHADIEAAQLGEETSFSADSHYEEKVPDGYYWHEEWETFENSLKAEARFFNGAAEQHLRSVFEGLETIATRDGRPMIVEAGPGTGLTTLYRARAFQSDNELAEALKRPDKLLGPPPSRAATAGRMNAQGISVFYGAETPQVALAEVRPPVGSQVAIAQFDTLRLLRLLDLTALSAASSDGSIFDPGLARRLERTMFLRSLSHRLTKPVMPNDEPFEYLPTQAVGDFLATGAVAELDGIIFPSVQTPGEARNVVLFHKAALVQELELPEGTKITASLCMPTDEGWERDYSVVEETPAEHESGRAESSASIFDFSALATVAAKGRLQYRSDQRDPTLQVNLSNIEVYIVEAVHFQPRRHPVHRHRWEQSDPDF